MHKLNGEQVHSHWKLVKLTALAILAVAGVLVTSQGSWKQRQSTFGEQQLILMLRDRPQMAPLLTKADPLWNLTVSYFEGGTCGRRVSWNPEEPKLSGFISNCRYPTPDRDECFIRLRKNNQHGELIDGELLWSGLFFEFFNLANQKDFLRIHNLALDGSLTRTSFIKMNTECEYRAVIKSAKFYEKVWEPEMRKKGITANSTYWVDSHGYDITKPSFEDWFSRLSDEDAYPYYTWGRFFDLSIVPYLQRSHSHKENENPSSK